MHAILYFSWCQALTTHRDTGFRLGRQVIGMSVGVEAGFGISGYLEGNVHKVNAGVESCC